ncbi:thiamine pyrophosphate-binding protein [Desulfopila inferna]|uniref:thiamine pyrophosphate-binding protein n=1 Tax=Desulfopila inferna TaxID=468528 RepID=UPI001962E378|nr:thiamine pyrophosphate-binding protein [Desulfopila inferna]MBM9605777.1 thiamine pyrophosphate-binding protein [Desulfopila inferna]
MNGAQIILEMLKLYEVKHVFGLPGETTIDLYDHWHDYPEIKHILTRDEKNSAFMAEAYAKITGKPGVVESPSPGVAHPAPGIAEAFAGSIPLIFFTSDVYPNDNKRSMLTGIDQTDFYSTICKESFILDRPEEIPFLMRRAFRVATSGRPGPVHLRMMWNCLSATADVADLYGQPECATYPSFRNIADPASLEKALEKLLQAENALIICGQGALSSGASLVIEQLAEALHIPVATTTTGKGAVSEVHPLSLGVVGARGGTAYTNGFIERADTIFYIGSNTDSTGTDAWSLPKLSDDKTILHLDMAPENIGNMYKTSVGMCGDARASVEFMLTLIANNNLAQKGPLQGFVEEREQARKKLFEAPVPDINQGIFPPHFVQVLDAILPDNGIIATEAGVCSIYTTPLFQMKKSGRRYLSNYSLGALGYAIPAALGAAYADESAPVIALTGDGSFGFNCGELETFVRTNKNVTIVLYRNDNFGWIKGETVLINDSMPFCTDFSKKTNYLKVAEAFGLHCQRLENQKDIERILKNALDHDGPSFIEMPVVSEDIIAPFVPKWIKGARKKNIPNIY